MTGFLSFVSGYPAAVFLLALVAGLVRGFTGFGQALAFVPVAAALIGPQRAVATIVVLDALLQAMMWRQAWAIADRKAVLPLIAGALVGAPIGVTVLIHAEPTMLRWAIAVAVFAAIGLVLSGWRLARAPGRTGSVVVGIVSGFFNGAATLGGLVAATFWLAGRGENATIRASLVIYLAFLTAFALFNLSVAGLLTLQLALATLPLAPGYGLGILLGMAAFRRFGGATYRPIAYAVVVLGAIISMPVLDAWLR